MTTNDIIIEAAVAAILTADPADPTYETMWRTLYDALPADIDCDASTASHAVATAICDACAGLEAGDVLGGGMDVGTLRKSAERGLDRDVAAAVVAAVMVARRLRADATAELARVQREFGAREAELLADGGLV